MNTIIYVATSICALLFIVILVLKRSVQSSEMFFELALVRTKSKLKLIESYLANPKASDVLEETYCDLKIALQFESITGIYAENKHREGLVNLHNKISHSASWKDIHRASEFIEIDCNGDPSIRSFSSSEKFIFSLSWLGLVLSLITSALTFLPIVLSQAPTNLTPALMALTLALLFIFTAIFFSIQLLPKISANKIRNSLEKIKGN